MESELTINIANTQITNIESTLTEAQIKTELQRRFKNFTGLILEDKNSYFGTVIYARSYWHKITVNSKNNIFSGIAHSR